MIDSVVLTEAPTLKLSNRTLPGRLSIKQLVDGCRVEIFLVAFLNLKPNPCGW